MATKAALLSEVTTNFPDNTTGLITPAVQRTTHNDEINSWQQAPQVNSQIGTTYTFLATDYGQIVLFNNASPVAASLPTPATTGFNPFNTVAKNNGAGTVTITPVAPSTIDGALSLALGAGQTAWIVSDGTNWRTGILAGAPQVISVGTTPVSGGTSGNFFSNNAGVFSERTPTQATAALNTFTSALQGLVPPSGGGATNFLRADGAWSVPAGGGGGTLTIGTTPISAGAAGRVLFDNAGVLGEDGGLVYNGNGRLNINFGTITSNIAALNITGTWNNSSVVFDAPLLMNITNTASAAGSRLVDLQLGGSSVVTADAFGLSILNQVGSPSSAINFIAGGANPGPAQQGFNFKASRGTIAAPTAVASGDLLGAFFGVPYTSSGYVFNASIGFIVDTPGGGTAAVFYTGTGGARPEKLRVDSNNSVHISNTTSAAGLRVYNTVDSVGSPVNFERSVHDWTVTANTLTIGTQAGGGGTVRDFAIVKGTATFFTSAVTTVAGLPAAGTKGRRHFVTDANATSFQSIVAGGGANNVPVFDDGANWRIG